MVLSKMPVVSSSSHSASEQPRPCLEGTHSPRGTNSCSQGEIHVAAASVGRDTGTQPRVGEAEEPAQSGVQERGLWLGEETLDGNVKNEKIWHFL